MNPLHYIRPAVARLGIRQALGRRQGTGLPEPEVGAPKRTASQGTGLREILCEGVLSADLAGRLREWNGAFRDMLGYSDEELARFAIRDLTPRRWLDLDERVVRAQLLPLGHAEPYVKEYRHKDGHPIPVELRLFLLERRGEPVGTLALVRNLGRRARARPNTRRPGGMEVLL